MPQSVLDTLISGVETYGLMIEDRLSKPKPREVTLTEAVIPEFSDKTP